jgi:hypothetical protein
MTRDQSNAIWLERCQGLRSSGVTMKDFAQREGSHPPSAFRGLRKARRSGLWSDEPKPGKAIAVAKPRTVAVFAQVAVSHTVRSSTLSGRGSSFSRHLRRNPGFIAAQRLTVV